MKSPNYYFEKAVNIHGTIFKLSEITGIPHRLLYKKRDQVYKVGEDMFPKSYINALKIEEACNGRVKAHQLCQKTHKYSKKIIELKNN